MIKALNRIDPTPVIKGPEADVPAPTPAIADDPEVEAAAPSVVRVLGTACGLGVSGSGWVAGPGMVATNAHVVAGQDDTTVTTQDGIELDATAVLYEPRNDLALLRVDGLDRAGAAARRAGREGGGGGRARISRRTAPTRSPRLASGRPPRSSARTPTAAARSGAR